METLGLQALSPRRLSRLAATALVAGAALLYTSAGARAQMNVEQLIGSAVSDIGPKFSEVQAAIQRFNDNDVVGAQQALERAIADHPQLPPVEILMAKLFASVGQTAAVRDQVERAVINHPADPEAYLLLANNALREGRNSEAMLLYDQAITLTEAFDANPKRKRNFILQAYNGRSLVSERRQDYETAVSYLTRLVEEDPENGAFQQRYGTALFMTAAGQGELANAYEAFRAAHKANADFPHPDVSTALLFHRQDKQDEARQAFERAAENDSQNAATMRAYASWLLERGDAAAAMQPLSQARNLDPTGFQGLLLSGVAAKMNDDPEQAEKLLLEALAVKPSDQDAINQLALLLVNQGSEEERDRALQYARMNAALYSNNPETQISLAWVHFRLSQLGIANASMQEANSAVQRANQLGIGNWNADSLYLLAQIQYENDKFDVARRLLEMAQNKKVGIFVYQKEAAALKQLLTVSGASGG